MKPLMNKEVYKSSETMKHHIQSFRFTKIINFIIKKPVNIEIIFQGMRAFFYITLKSLLIFQFCVLTVQLIIFVIYKPPLFLKH